MTTEQYWQVRAVVLEQQHFEQRVLVEAAAIRTKVREVLTAAGLEVGREYRLNDDTLTAEPVKP